MTLATERLAKALTRGSDRINNAATRGVPLNPSIAKGIVDSITSAMEKYIDEMSDQLVIFHESQSKVRQILMKSLRFMSAIPQSRCKMCPIS